MTMSKRRLQFLDQLVSLYKKQRLPIHYEALAKAIGVSKWTAYDMLKAIEKSGFVTRSYETNPNETGRSQVMFTPTEKATVLLGKQQTPPIATDRGEDSLIAIREMIGKLKRMPVQELMKKLLNELPDKRSNLELCGYILGILIIYVKKIEGRTDKLIFKLYDRTAGQHARLLMFIGTVIGTVFQTMSDELSSELVELVGNYVKMIGELTHNEQAMLAEFVREALV